MHKLLYLCLVVENKHMPYTIANKKTRRDRHTKMYVALLGLIALLIIIGGLYQANKLPFWHRASIIPTTGSSYTKGTPSTGGPSSTSPSHSVTKTNTNSSNQGSDTAPPITQQLTAPWGTYANVSTAKMGQQMESTCNTTPGATCEVIFTNNGVTKHLDPEVTDAGGAVYWAWVPQSIGLTPGTWHMTMKATLGGDTKTTSDDPLTLEITS